MQLMDSTASEYGVRNILDPYENIMGGTKYLRYLLDFFEEDLSLTLSAYNAGLDAVLKFKGIPPFPETINYVQTIFKILESPNKKMNIKDHQKGSNLSMVRDGFGNIIITN